MPLSIHYSSRRNRLSRKCQAFTLTELFICVLIVFAIALIIPLFTKARACARCASGASNQKQVALAFLQYIQDYDARFPSGVGYVQLSPQKPDSPVAQDRYAQNWGPDRLLPDGRTVPGILSPYVKNNQTFLDEYNGKRADKRILEYMYNDLLIHQREDSIANIGLTVLTISAEDRFANVGHAYTPNAGPYSAVFNANCGCDAEKGASIRSARTRHSDGANAAFADGHVKWFVVAKAGSNDQIFFPPRDSASISAVDPATKLQVGPQPGGDMEFQGQHYGATFHIR